MDTDDIYRDPQSANQATLDALKSEVRQLKAQIAQAEAQRETLIQLENEIAALEKRMESSRKKPSLLRSLRLASPCDQTWEDMLGDDVQRFCGGCNKQVYCISSMTTDEAERFLEAAAGAACVRFYQRSDGTLLTQDCPTGASRMRRRRVALTMLGVGVTTFSIGLFVSENRHSLDLIDRQIEAEIDAAKTKDIEINKHIDREAGWHPVAGGISEDPEWTPKAKDKDAQVEEGLKEIEELVRLAQRTDSRGARMGYEARIRVIQNGLDELRDVKEARLGPRIDPLKRYDFSRRGSSTR